MCKINLNQELNGIELSFESKPDKATLDSIKAQGFRWNGRKMVWYAKQTADRLTFAESLGQIENKTATKPGKINLDNLGADPYENGELAKAIREALKKRGVKGCTVRGGWSGYTRSATVTVKAQPEDFASVEEFKLRYTYNEFVFDMANHGRYIGGGVDGLEYGWLYSDMFEQLTEAEKEKVYNLYCLYEIAHRHDFNTYHRERKNYPQFTTAFCEKLDAVFQIANQWNYNHSDIMTDYFDVGYYLDINIKADEIEPREKMTDEEREALKAEREAEEARRAAELEEWKRQEEERAEAARIREEERKEREELVYNNIRVEDLEESEQLYIWGLRGGYGKECNIEEVKEDMTEQEHEAVIDRKIIFNNREAYEAFTAELLNDWLFLSGKGGTASEDVRITEEKTIYQMNEEQRESIRFYCCNCVGIYLDNELLLVIDPQGFSYARYTYINPGHETRSAAHELEKMRKESESLPPFHFPDDIDEVITTLYIGQDITVYQCDGWMLNSIYAGSGTITDISAGTWAQYSGYYITLSLGKKSKRVFIHNGRECLIYEGIKGRLPEEVTSRRISDSMKELHNVDDLLPNTYNYYKSQGAEPLIDTCYR